MKNSSTKAETTTSSLPIGNTDVIRSFLKDNLQIGISADGTCITVKIWLGDEVITECTECISIYKRDVYGLD